jgi:DNA repair exonuclease SbcCD ATPase subunit
VRRFKALTGERIINFSPGLNIIKGSDNEAGKSSLREAIVKALYQDPTTIKGNVIGLTSWGTDEPWEVELEFQDDSKSYQITKSLKDRSCKLIDIGTPKIITNKNAIASKVAELTGCPSEVFFESTACIRQDELIRIIPQTVTENEKQRAMGTITKRLQGALTSAEGVDVPAIVSRLYKKTHHQAARGPYSHLQEINSRIKRLESDKESFEEKVSRVMENRRKLNSIKEKLQKINEDLPPKEDLFEKNKKILELEKEIERDKSQYKNFTRAKDLKLNVDRQNEELKGSTCFEGAEGKIKQLQTDKSEIENFEKRRFELQEKIKTFQGLKPALWTLILGLILVVAGLMGLIITTYLVVVAIAGLLLSVYWLISQKMWSAQIKTMTSGIEDLETPIQSAKDKTRNILNELGFENYDICLKRFEEYNKVLSARKETENMLKGIVGDKTWDEFEKENSDLDIQVRAAQKESKSYLPFKIDDPLKLQELEKAVKKLQKEKEELEREKGALEKFFELTDADTDRLASIAEELKWLKEERGFYERKTKIYNITRELLDESHRQTLSKATDILEEELGRYISTITCGRYNKVEVNEKDLSIWTVSPEKENKVEILELSRATQDQFYISARFALAKLITEGKKPPLLLDDPFVNFHPKRLERMISLLQKLAEENQILLFTCSDAYDDYGNVIFID